MKAVFVKAGVVIGVSQFSAGALSSNDPDVTIQYVADDQTVSAGDLYVDGVFEPGVPTPPVPPKVAVIEYKMLFTSAERIAVKASADPVIIDLQELMNDPRTLNVDLSLKSVQDALDYMTHLGILADGRKEEILTGVIL